MSLKPAIEQARAVLESVETDPSKVTVVWDAVLGGRYQTKKSLEKLVHHLRVDTPFKIGKTTRAEEGMTLCNRVKPEALAGDGSCEADPEPKCPKCVEMAAKLGLKPKIHFD